MCLGSWEEQTAFSFHPCSDISILWAFSEMAVRCSFRVVTSVTGWLSRGQKSSAWGWKYFESVSLGAGPGEYADNKARLIPWKGALGPHTECSMGAHWENPRPRFQAVRGELCTLIELKPGGSVCALSNDCVLSFTYSSTIGYWKGQSPACSMDSYQEPLEKFRKCLPHIVVPAEFFLLPGWQ